MRNNRAAWVGGWGRVSFTRKGCRWLRAVCRHKMCPVLNFHFIMMLLANRCDRNKANRCSATIFIFRPTVKKKWIHFVAAATMKSELRILVARAMKDQIPLTTWHLRCYFCHLFALCHRLIWETTNEMNESQLIRGSSYLLAYGIVLIDQIPAANFGIFHNCYRSALAAVTGFNYILTLCRLCSARFGLWPFCGKRNTSAKREMSGWALVRFFVQFCGPDETSELLHSGGSPISIRNSLAVRQHVTSKTRNWSIHINQRD